MDGLRSLTRRRMLQIASASPFAILGASACDERVGEEIRSAVAFQPQLPDGVEIPADCHPEIIECGPQNADPVHVIELVDKLWGQFLAGVDSITPGREVLPGVFHTAYAMSGPFVVCHTEDFKNENWNHKKTNDCCKICGGYAAEEAKKRDNGNVISAVNPHDFVEAWCRTRTEQTAKIQRARRVFPAQIGGGLGDSPTGGWGCG